MNVFVRGLCVYARFNVRALCVSYCVTLYGLLVLRAFVCWCVCGLMCVFVCDSLWDVVWCVFCGFCA